MKFIGVIVPLVLSGCVSIPDSFSNVIANAGKDNASICASVQGPWGSATIMRSNSPGSDIKGGCQDLSHGSPPPAQIVAVDPQGRVTLVRP